MGMTTTHSNSDSIDCPHCGGRNTDLGEHELEDDDEVLFACAHCGRTVKLSAKVTYAYTAETLEPPHDVVEDTLEQSLARVERARVRYIRLVEVGAPQVILDNEQKLIDKWAANVTRLGGTPPPRDCTACPHSKEASVNRVSAFRCCTHPKAPSDTPALDAPVAWPVPHYGTCPPPGCPLEDRTPPEET